MTKLLLWAACGVVACAAGMTALAQDLPAPRDAAAPPPGPAAPQGGGMRRADAVALAARAFAALDADGDGAVTRAEYDAARQARRAARMARGGGNGDAPPAARPDGPGSGRGMGMGMGARWFDMADANGDGRVTLAEAQAAAGAAFDRMDADHDGVVTPEERHAAMAAMRGGSGRPPQ